jgi:phosphoglucosamine mutase
MDRAGFMKALFGTDGIRGHAGEFPLDDRSVFAIGASVARQFGESLGRAARFVIGRDTRESGPQIEAAFCAGAASAGAECVSADVITTPGVAYLTSAFEFDAGVVVSASHNPYQDNGIKIFSPSGKKIDGGVERLIEADVYAARDSSPTLDSQAGSLRSSGPRSDDTFHTVYLQHLVDEVNGLDLSGKKIVLDCANGAASALAPELFTRLGAEVMAINDRPDGRNINLDCGSLHLEGLQAKVREAGADAGVAFDGDADRALFVDERGEIVDGDATMWVMARYLKEHGKLANSTVVATVMSNIGLEKALESVGVQLDRTSVGDKYVLEELLETGSAIGGEQSGHIILPEISLVGDGMMTALMLLRAVVERGTTLSQAVEGFTKYPQILVNVKVGEKRPFEDVPEIAAAAAGLEKELDGSGRLLLRYSGTENLARVMIEGQDQAAIDAQALRLADIIAAALPPR